MPRKKYTTKQIRPRPGREEDYRSEETPEYEVGDFFATRHPKRRGMSAIAKDYHFYAKMPQGDYAPLGFQMHRAIRLQKEMKEFVDWLNTNIGSIDGTPEGSRELYELISQSKWANTTYRGYPKESLRRVIRNILLETYRANCK